MVRSLLAVALTMVVVIACSSTESVKREDMFVVSEQLRETATVQMGSDNDGFTKFIPEGTKLKAVFSTTPAASYFECVPVEVNGQDDPDYIETFFVPESMRMSEEYQGFTFSLPVEYIGSKIKRIK